MFRFLKNILCEQRSYVSRWSKRRAQISFPPAPILSKKTSVFTIGSCFASNLAAFMGEFNINGSTHPGRPFYHTKSILQELEKLAEESQKQQQVQAWESKDGFQSPYMNHMETESFKSLNEFRNWTEEINLLAHERLHQAGIVVITLGLIEAWYHAPSDTYFKQCPPASVFKRLKPEFRRLTVGEMYDDLVAIRKIVCDRLRSQLIITVSPVPLICTFMPYDVQVANNESKSRIRAAVSEFIDSHPDVHYFPSFEIVSAGERMTDFMKKDGRHLHPDAIRYVINQFCNCFSDQKLPVDVTSEKWLTPLEKTYTTPDCAKDYPKGRAKDISDMLVKDGEKVFIYGEDEWTLDFLYTSGILRANLVGFVADEYKPSLCGQSCVAIDDLKKQPTSWVVVTQRRVGNDKLSGLKTVFSSDRIVMLKNEQCCPR